MVVKLSQPLQTRMQSLKALYKWVDILQFEAQVVIFKKVANSELFFQKCLPGFKIFNLQ
jgi:hypothetical protein